MGRMLPHAPRREWRETYWRSTLSMRDCQPSPVDLKYSKTSELYRTETSFFVFSDFGRPRNARIGIISFSCLGVNGCASASALAAAVIALSSATVGIAIETRLDCFDILLYLTTVSSAQANNPSHCAAVHKRHVVEDFRLRRESNHSQLVIFEAVVQPNQCCVPIKFSGHRERYTVLY